MLPTKRENSREKILRAATELAQEVGPAHISLDAVAARAGLSKGGLLYSFPTKAKILEAMVEKYMQEHEQAMAVQETLQSGERNRVARAFLDVYRIQADKEPPACGVLAALAENPDLWCLFDITTGLCLTAWYPMRSIPTPHSSPIWQLPECKAASFSIAISSPMPSNIPCSAAWKPC